MKRYVTRPLRDGLVVVGFVPHRNEAENTLTKESDDPKVIAQRRYWAAATGRKRLKWTDEKKKSEYKKHYKALLANNAKRKMTPEGGAKSVIPKIKHRCKVNKTEFDITWKDVLPPPTCPVLGLPLHFTGAKGIFDWNYPSVDRWDNSKGYVCGNVRVISLRANLLKKDATLLELQALVKYMSGETE